MLLVSNNHYAPELKEKSLPLYLEKIWTKKSLTEEYHLRQGTITYWLHNSITTMPNKFHNPFKNASYNESKTPTKRAFRNRKENTFLKKRRRSLQISKYMFYTKARQ